MESYYTVFANDILDGRNEDFVNQFKERNQSFWKKADLALILDRTPLTDKGHDAISVIAHFYKVI